MKGLHPVLTLKEAMHTVARIKNFDDRNPRSTGFREPVGIFVGARELQHMERLSNVVYEEKKELAE